MFFITSKVCLAVVALLLSMVQSSTQLTVSQSSSTSSASSSSTVNGQLVSANCVNSVNGVTTPCGSPLLATVPPVITTVTP